MEVKLCLNKKHKNYESMLLNKGNTFVVEGDLHVTTVDKASAIFMLSSCGGIFQLVSPAKLSSDVVIKGQDEVIFVSPFAKEEVSEDELKYSEMSHDDLKELAKVRQINLRGTTKESLIKAHIAYDQYQKE